MPANAEDPYAEQQVSFALRELAANIIRVTRGAGRVFEISMQAQALLKAMAEYRDAVGHYPPAHDLGRMLRVDVEPDRLTRMPMDRQSELRAQQTIIRGALQVVASRLLDQELPEQKGEDELRQGIRDLREMEEAASQRRQAEQEAAREAALAARRAAEKARRAELKERRAAEDARKAAARKRRRKPD